MHFCSNYFFNSRSRMFQTNFTDKFWLPKKLLNLPISICIIISPTNMCDTFLQLKCQCPATGCNNKEVCEWKYSNCSHCTMINSDALLKCSGCSSRTPSSIINHRFNCGKHHDNEFLAVNSLGLTSSLAMMRSCQNDIYDKVWISKLAKSFMKEIMKLDE